MHAIEKSGSKEVFSLGWANWFWWTWSNREGMISWKVFPECRRPFWVFSHVTVSCVGTQWRIITTTYQKDHEEILSSPVKAAGVPCQERALLCWDAGSEGKIEPGLTGMKGCPQINPIIWPPAETTAKMLASPLGCACTLIDSPLPPPLSASLSFYRPFG